MDDRDHKDLAQEQARSLIRARKRGKAVSLSWEDYYRRPRNRTDRIAHNEWCATMRDEWYGPIGVIRWMTGSYDGFTQREIDRSIKVDLDAWTVTILDVDYAIDHVWTNGDPDSPSTTDMVVEVRLRDGRRIRAAGDDGWEMVL